MTNPGNKNILSQPGYPLLYGANKIADGYNFAVEAEEESQVSLLFYKKKTPDTARSLPNPAPGGRMARPR